MEKSFNQKIELMVSQNKLSFLESKEIVFSILDGQYSDIRLSALLTALKSVPLTEDFFLGCLEGLAAQVKPIHFSAFKNIVDCSGTGGDAVGTVNLSTMASIIATAAGAQVAKFGNRSVTSRCGSADVLEALGVQLAQSAEDVALDLARVGISFVYSGAFFPHFKHLSQVRRSLGFQTIFDVLFPLINPVNLFGQLVGVNKFEYAPYVAKALLNLGRKRVLVVLSEDGLDEISCQKPTRILEVQNGQFKEMLFDPKSLGMHSNSINSLRGGAPEENAEKLMQLLNNVADRALTHAALLNAGAALWCSGLVSSLQEGVENSKMKLKSGEALQVLEQWRQVRHSKTFP
jgi:anthranilate phosphoribosyltransferase